MHERLDILRRSLAVAVVALLAATALVATSAATAATNCTPSSSWGTNRGDLASQVITLINQHRASIGRSPLGVSGSLTASSVWKSLHMAGYGYFSHSDPAPPASRSAFQRAKDCDYGGSAWSENIAWGYGSAQSVVSGWLNSPGHKSNIESGSYTTTGVGVAANASGQLYWTQNFGNDGSSGTPPPSPTPPPPTPPAPTPPAPTTPTFTPPTFTAPTFTAPAPTPPAAAAASPVTVVIPAGPSQAAGAPATASVLPAGGKPARVIRLKQRARLDASVAFVHLTTGRPLATGSVRCRAEVDGKRLRVLANTFEAKSARCAWRIPGWAKGKQLTGVVAVQIGAVAVRRLFIRTMD